MVSGMSSTYMADQDIAQETAACLLDSLMDSVHQQRVAEKENLMSKFLKLGLIDSLLRLSLKSNLSGDNSFQKSLDHLEKLIENRYYNTLEDVNPILEQTTLELILESLREEEDKELTMNVITTVIFALSIFLIKLDPEDIAMVNRSMADLELQFAFLTTYLNELTFSASDILVRATNTLVVAIKSRLAMIAENELIRESFRTIIETVAGRCLIETRYKSAAVLYSQMEDNVNAVKALMRAGDPDTVINFALLVRDLTVNRITINYLRHLKVDVKIIETFIARAQS